MTRGGHVSSSHIPAGRGAVVACGVWRCTKGEGMCGTGTRNARMILFHLDLQFMLPYKTCPPKTPSFPNALPTPAGFYETVLENLSVTASSMGPVGFEERFCHRGQLHDSTGVGKKSSSPRERSCWSRPCWRHRRCPCPRREGRCLGHRSGPRERVTGDLRA